MNFLPKILKALHMGNLQKGVDIIVRLATDFSPSTPHLIIPVSLICIFITA
jgi:hypothetical protein